MNSISMDTFRVGDWRVDPRLDEISLVDLVVRLEPRLMRLLLRLVETPGVVVSPRELLDCAWKGVAMGPASVSQAVAQLRKLLGDTESTATYIATVPRAGYRLVAPVERLRSPFVPELAEPQYALPSEPTTSVLVTGLRHLPPFEGPWPPVPDRIVKLGVLAVVCVVVGILSLLLLVRREESAATPSPADTAIATHR